MSAITCIYNTDKNNIGDWTCSPVQTLFIGAETCSVYESELDHKNIIFGGGGLINNFFGPYITKHLNRTSGARISWGIGHNFDATKYIESYPDWINRFTLSGIRDWPTPSGSYYVPCASCLSPVFDIEFDEPKHEVVFFKHNRIKSPITDIPSMFNSENRLLDVASFLSSGRTVVTNSYHGAYWSMLLNRNTIVINPWSSKFYGFKISPHYCNNYTLCDALKRPPIDYSGFKDECRDANFKFAKLALNVLE